MRASVCRMLCVAGAMLVASRASAGGIEYTGAGAQALGRGGAVTAKANDPMVLLYNPAGLAELRGSQLAINANLALMDACMEPIGYYGWGAYGGGKPAKLVDPNTGEALTLNLGNPSMIGPAEQSYYNSKLDTVCLDQDWTPIPQVGFSARLSEAIGVGFGLLFPNAPPQGRWGGEDGTISTPNGPRPAPTRYLTMRSGTLALYPTFGIGVRLTDWLRIGASFQWGIFNVDQTNMAVVSAGTTPSGDIITRVRVTDWFVPAIAASLHIVPFDAVDIVGAFRYHGDLNAPGTIDMTTGFADPNAQAYTTINQITGVKQRFPWQLRAGIRYASRLAPRPSGTGNKEPEGFNGDRIHDALEDERWDIEFDIEYQMNSRMSEQRVEYQPNQSVQSQGLDGTVRAAMFPDASQPYTVIPKGFKDQISARVGGTYNLFPGLFAISIGGHYETRGVDPAYMQLDYWPVSRIGLHAGVMLRVSRTIDLIASFSHIFQETLVVAAPMHKTGEAIYEEEYRVTGKVSNIDQRSGTAASRGMQAPVLAAENPAGAHGEARLTQNLTKTSAGEPPVIINSGTYRSGMNVLAVGMNVHF